MDTFLANISTFPVIVYTALLMFVLMYWLMTLLGVLDIEMFDADIDIETDFETEVSINPDAEGLSGIAGIMFNWGLTGVPVTVVVSILVFTSWLICYLAVSLIYPLIPLNLLKYVMGVILLVVSFAVSIPITARLIRPLKRFFIVHTAVKKATLIGRECEVKSSKVNETFGQGLMEDGEAGIILDIRAPSDENIKKGDTVILIEYIKKYDFYNVGKI